jgi:hypothetical protein
MSVQKFVVNNYTLHSILGFIDSNEIAIPEIQRPFVWKPTKVRDLIDSLFAGYPVGYLIIWKNPDVKLKGGGMSEGKKVLIDGQQRITALMAAVRGLEIITDEYKKRKITIAFNPMNIGDPSENAFEVLNPAISKNTKWFEDISRLINPSESSSKIVRSYCKANDITDQDDMDKVSDNIHALQSIVNMQIGVIELNSDLDIETVTDIFIRINSKGQELSQADFAMSKIAANETYGGDELRKCIDYFCHLAVAPWFYEDIKNNDKKFAGTEYFKRMEWLKDENDDIYDPSYSDMLRVSFTSEFKRGKMQDLVALLSGRVFETRSYEEEKAEQAFASLKKSIMRFMSEYDFKHFVTIIRSSGFIDSSMVRSQNVLNFAYILFLIGRNKKVDQNKLEKLVRKWFVFSIITGRYSGSPESMFDLDVRRIDEIGLEKYVELTTEATLSESYWAELIPMRMNTSVASSPLFKLYLAAHIYNNEKGFLSKDIEVKDLTNATGNIHHIFPKAFLIKNEYRKEKYNQIANYVIMQDNINVTISDKEPKQYFNEIIEGINIGNNKFGNIEDLIVLNKNFEAHCMPTNINTLGINDYEYFLDERRKLMANKIKGYYLSL